MLQQLSGSEVPFRLKTWGVELKFKLCLVISKYCVDAVHTT